MRKIFIFFFVCGRKLEQSEKTHENMQTQKGVGHEENHLAGAGGPLGKSCLQVIQVLVGAPGLKGRNQACETWRMTVRQEFVSPAALEHSALHQHCTFSLTWTLNTNLRVFDFQLSLQGGIFIFQLRAFVNVLMAQQR